MKHRALHCSEEVLKVDDKKQTWLKGGPSNHAVFLPFSALTACATCLKLADCSASIDVAKGGSPIAYCSLGGVCAAPVWSTLSVYPEAGLSSSGPDVADKTGLPLLVE